MVRFLLVPFPWGCFWPPSAHHNLAEPEGWKASFWGCSWHSCSCAGCGFLFAISGEPVSCVLIFCGSPYSRARRPLHSCRLLEPTNVHSSCGVPWEEPLFYLLFQLFAEPYLWHIHRAGLRDCRNGWRFARCLHRREAEDCGPSSPRLWRGRKRWAGCLPKVKLSGTSWLLPSNQDFLRAKMLKLKSNLKLKCPNSFSF